MHRGKFAHESTAQCKHSVSSQCLFIVFCVVVALQMIGKAGPRVLRRVSLTNYLIFIVLLYRAVALQTIGKAGPRVLRVAMPLPGGPQWNMDKAVSVFMFSLFYHVARLFW